MSAQLLTTRLNNGLLIATEPLKHVETVSLGIYVHAGSRDEQPHENGIAHFLEHMAFKGTPKRSARKIAEDVENVGGVINACTSREQTIFYIKLLKEHLSLGVDILGDIMNHSLFEPEEIERERGVILQEIAQSYDTPDDIIFDYYQERAFPDQSLGRPILGPASLVKQFDRNALINFMQKHYTPNRIVIAAAGALDHDRLVKEIEQQFSAPSHPTARHHYANDYQGGITKIPRNLDQAHMVLGFPTSGYRDTSHIPALLLGTLLGGGISSRLFWEIREKRGLVYTIFSAVNSYRDKGLFTIYSAAGAQQAPHILPILRQELDKVQQHITREELTRSKAQLKAALLMSLESTDNRCDRIAQHLQLFGRSIPIKETIERINDVTPQQIHQIAQKIFAAPFTFAALGATQNLPSTERLEEVLTS